MKFHRNGAPQFSQGQGPDREAEVFDLVRRAQHGDKDAVVAIVKNIQDRVYNLAFRMLWHPSDAEDASQEILVRIITHLGSFRQECAFNTWVYRIACNYLLTTRKRRAERKEVTFEYCREVLEQGLAVDLPTSPSSVEQSVMVEETMAECIQALLLCLNRDLRMAFVLGDLFEVPGAEAAEVLDITPATFRKRLSRARGVLRAFMQANCGLVNVDNRCRCEKQAAYAAAKRQGAPEQHRNSGRLEVINGTASLDRVLALDELRHIDTIFRSLPNYRAPNMPGRVFDEIIESAKCWLVHADE